MNMDIVTLTMILLILQIVECATINLTFVYALLAYQHIRNLNIGNERVRSISHKIQLTDTYSLCIHT